MKTILCGKQSTVKSYFTPQPPGWGWRVSESPLADGRERWSCAPVFVGVAILSQSLEVSLLINGKLGFPGQKAATRGEGEGGEMERISGDMTWRRPTKWTRGEAKGEALGSFVSNISHQFPGSFFLHTYPIQVFSRAQLKADVEWTHWQRGANSVSVLYYDRHYYRSLIINP